MKKTIDLAVESYEKGNSPNACILCDPSSKFIIATAIDETEKKENSISHPIMNLLKAYGKSNTIYLSHNENHKAK